MASAEFLEFEQVYLQTLGRGIRTLSICAANSGEGVSTLACALAERHQACGRATLLVDMNLWRPSLNARFSLERVSWHAQPHSYHTAVMNVAPGLDVLTASAAPVSGFRQLDAIQSMLNTWLTQYDAVVIDTSPLNAINKNNIPAELLCSCTEGTIMVVKTAVTRQEELLQAVNRLRAYQVNIFGVVMNDVEFPSLRTELHREGMRLMRRFPRLAGWLLRLAQRSHMINIRI